MSNDLALHGSTTEPARISCTVCDREVPLSEAVVPEARDYVVYLCGLDCYERWRNANDATS